MNKNLNHRFEQLLKRTLRESLKSSSLLREKDDDADVADDIFDDANDDAKVSQKVPAKKADDDDDDDIFADAGDDASDDADADADVADNDSKKGGTRMAHAAEREKPVPDIDDMSVDLIVSKLNAIRSGQSLKDEDVKQHLEEWYDSLNSTQRLALFAFLEGLAEIIALGRDGEIARSPDDPDINVDMKHIERDTNIDTPDAAANVMRVVKKSSEEYARRPSTPAVTRVQSGAVSNDDAPVLVVKRG